MGEVYLAEQQSIGTRVAVKLLQAAISEDKDHVQRFFNEARAVSRIQHAGIVKIFDVGFHTQTGQAYLIMEYLEGESLGHRIRRSPLALSEVADVGRQIASVLEATHAAGITHRDLKPDNIYLVPDRELASKERVKVLDFGIAKLSGTLGASSPRTVGTLGTPAYMAPEQWGDSSKVDGRADIYALGCVTFEMMCGRPPFEARTYAEACAQHLTMEPPRVSSIVPDAPPALDDLLARLLAKDPAARPQSLHDVVAAFTLLANDPSAASVSRVMPRMSESGHPRPVVSDHVSGDGPTLATTSAGVRDPREATAETAVHVPPPAPSTNAPVVAPSTNAAAVAPSPNRRALMWLIPIGIVALAASAFGARYWLRDDSADKPPDIVPESDAATAVVVVEVVPDAVPIDGLADAPADAGASAQTLDRAVEVFLRNRDRLIACYTKHGLRTGRIEITVEVAAAGTVKSVALAGADPKAERCLHDTTKSLAFGKSPTDFTKPWLLEFKVPTPTPTPTPPVQPPNQSYAKARLEYLQEAMQRIRLTRSIESCPRGGEARAKMSITITAKGRVKAITIHNLPPSAQQCVKAIVMAIRFAPVPAILEPPTTITAHYVFGNKPGQGIVIPSPPGD
jgi:serine/threonine protein kinase